MATTLSYNIRYPHYCKNTNLNDQPLFIDFTLLPHLTHVDPARGVPLLDLLQLLVAACLDIEDKPLVLRNEHVSLETILNCVLPHRACVHSLFIHARVCFILANVPECLTCNVTHCVLTVLKIGIMGNRQVEGMAQLCLCIFNKVSFCFFNNPVYLL